MNPHPFAPEEEKTKILQSFIDPERPAYGMVANIDQKNAPQLRTVHIHYVPEWDALTFNGHLDSEKWKDLQKHPVLSGCYWDIHRAVQIRFEGPVEFATPSGKKYESLMRKMWDSTREQVRLAYWLDFKNRSLHSDQIDDIDLAKICPKFVTFICFPEKWDLFWANPAEYRKGSRILFHLVEGKWKKQEVCILHDRR